MLILAMGVKGIPTLANTTFLSNLFKVTGGGVHIGATAPTATEIKNRFPRGGSKLLA